MELRSHNVTAVGFVEMFADSCTQLDGEGVRGARHVPVEHADVLLLVLGRNVEFMQHLPRLIGERVVGLEKLCTITPLSHQERSVTTRVASHKTDKIVSLSVDVPKLLIERLGDNADVFISDYKRFGSRGCLQRS